MRRVVVVTRRHGNCCYTVGLDYLWDCVLQVNESIVHKPIELMKDIFTNLSSKLPQEQVS